MTSSSCVMLEQFNIPFETLSLKLKPFSKKFALKTVGLKNSGDAQSIRFTKIFFL